MALYWLLFGIATIVAVYVLLLILAAIIIVVRREIRK